MNNHPQLPRFFAVVLLACTAVLPTLSMAQGPTHNIVFIAVDDLRTWVNYDSDYTGTDIHGHSVHTPNIDALAASSTRYLNAYTTMPQCTASRTSVMFGLSPATHGLTFLSFESDATFQAIYSNPALTTIPEAMSAGGYHSAAGGKVFNTQIPARWDEVGPAIDYSLLYNPFVPGPDNTYIDPGVLPPGETHPDQGIANWGIDFINNYATTTAGIAGKPFFLAVGFYQPHMPWRVPQAYYDLYPLNQVVPAVPVPGDLDDLPAAGVNLAEQPKFSGVLTQYDLVQAAGKAAEYTQAYLASISHTDDMIGQLLAALAASPYAANTSVILWSDHGYHLGEKFHWRKMTLWEQAVKVPLLVSSPGNPNYPVSDVTEEVSLLDLAATVIDLAGLPPVTQFEGAPLYDTQNRSPAEIFLNHGKATVVNGVKTIDYDLGVPGVLDQESYDLIADPNEITNTLYIPGC